jgi:hypothetical protein
MSFSWEGRMRVIEVMKHEACVSLEAVDAVWQTLPYVKCAHFFTDIHFTTTGVCVRHGLFNVLFLDVCAIIRVDLEKVGDPIEYQKHGFEKIGMHIHNMFIEYLGKMEETTRR